MSRSRKSAGDVEHQRNRQRSRAGSRTYRRVQELPRSCPNCWTPFGERTTRLKSNRPLGEDDKQRFAAGTPAASAWVSSQPLHLVFVALSCLGVMYLGPYGWFVLMPVQRIAVFATLGAGAALLAFALVRRWFPVRRLVPPGLLPIGPFGLLCMVVASVFQVQTGGCATFLWKLRQPYDRKVQ